MNVFESLVGVLELAEQSDVLCNVNDLRIRLVVLHVVLPPLVDTLEKFGLLRKLLLNIFSIENIFKIHPSSLTIDLGKLSEYYPSWWNIGESRMKRVGGYSYINIAAKCL